MILLGSTKSQCKQNKFHHRKTRHRHRVLLGFVPSLTSEPAPWRLMLPIHIGCLALFCPIHQSGVASWLWLKQTVPKWNPATWKHGPKPAVCPSCLILSHTHLSTGAQRKSSEGCETFKQSLALEPQNRMDLGSACFLMEERRGIFGATDFGEADDGSSLVLVFVVGKTTSMTLKVCFFDPLPLKEARTA